MLGHDALSQSLDLQQVALAAAYFFRCFVFKQQRLSFVADRDDLPDDDLNTSTILAAVDLRLCLPQIKREHIGDADHPGSDGTECVLLPRRNVISARPCSTIGECACHYTLNPSLSSSP